MDLKNKRMITFNEYDPTFHSPDTWQSVIDETYSVISDLVTAIEEKWINRKSQPPKELVEPYKHAKEFLRGVTE